MMSNVNESPDRVVKEIRFAPFEAEALTDDTIVLGGPKGLGVYANPDAYIEVVVAERAGECPHTELADNPILDKFYCVKCGHVIDAVRMLSAGKEMWMLTSSGLYARVEKVDR